MRNRVQGFTLIELLVVISIIAILLALSIFGIQGARESSRDAKRKADLELIRSGLEMYKSDCGTYPVQPTAAELPSSLVGSGTPPSSCPATNTYISSVPKDPSDPGRKYIYASSTGATYKLCAALEQGSGTVVCALSSDCGETCNYRVENP